ncbi:MAG: ABC transporter permease subunit [Pseudomonadota bacterium]
MRLINRRPGRHWALALAVLPFVLLLVLYSVASEIRRAENPRDKLLPAPATVVETAWRLATVPERRSGKVLLWTDTGISLARLGTGLAIAAALGLGFGIAIGLFPYVSTVAGPLTGALAMIPPLAVLPILFLALGLGETSKIALIVIGITPVIIRDLAARTAEIPREQIVKAETLGASSLAIALRVALPQAMPRLILALRLALGPALLFLIAAEAIASEAGLGYRIFLVRRYLAMDVILVYVVWITLLALTTDRLLAMSSRLLFPWAAPARPAP